MPHGVEVVSLPFLPDVINGMRLVVIVDAPPTLRAEIAALCHQRGTWLSVLHTKTDSTALLPEVVQRDGLILAVCSGEAGPALEARISRQLAVRYGDAYTPYIALLRRLRHSWEPRADAAGLSHADRRRVWEMVLEMPLFELVSDGDTDEAEWLARTVLDQQLQEHAAR
jgi:siroheme synthase (precorrin-2 oxidase/ferrochelatase)